MGARVVRRITLAIAILTVLATAASAESRTWKDNTGKFSIEAELVEVKQESVVLKKANGSTITVPIARLSKVDREYLLALEQPAVEPPSSKIVRRYPSFPGGVTEAPSWLVRSAPFDVEEYFKAPPPEENASTLYLEALLEFNDEVLMCFWPKDEVPIEEAKRLRDKFRPLGDTQDKFYAAWEKDPKSLDNVEVDAWLAEFETGFEKLAIAQKRSECVFQTGINFLSLLPHAQAPRQVARVVMWRSRRDLQRDDIERLIRDIEITLRLSRDLQRRGGFVCQLVSKAVDGICCSDAVPRILRSDAIEQEHCRRLLAILEQHEEVSRRRFAEGTRAEYVMSRKVLHDFQHHTGDISPQSLKDLDIRGTDHPMTWVKLLIELDGLSSGRIAKEKYGKKGTGIPQDHPFVVGWTVSGKLMSDDDYAKEVDALNRVYASILDSADQSGLKRLEIVQNAEVYEPLRDTKVALFLEPFIEPLINAMLQADAIMRGTKCLVALRQWQLDHENPPPNLKTMVQAAGMLQVPIDPYSDQPMLMTIIDEQVVIYSVALDGKDDQALVEWDLNTRNPKGDMLFRLSIQP